MLALAQGVLRYAKTEEQYESQVLCASDWEYISLWVMWVMWAI